jgi:hypothetical protein
MLTIPNLGVPYTLVHPTRESSQATAWRSPGPTTIRIHRDLERAIRVHLNGRIPGGSDWLGSWFAIGESEHITTKAGYTGAVALKHSFTHVDTWTIKAGSLLNVGWAAPLFGRSGGGFQAELLYKESPPAVRVLAGAVWVDRVGNA